MSEARAQVMHVELWLRVENNSKFVRGKTKVRQHIEELVLRPLGMQKSDPKGWEYTLTIPYRSEAELEERITDLLQEADAIADRHFCFIEADVRALDGSDRSW